MGKMQEALLKAQKETDDGHLMPVLLPRDDLVPVRYIGKDIDDSPEWFRELKTKLLIYYGQKTKTTIMFTGTSLGSGTTTIAAGFASNLAKENQFKVLLIDANFRSSAHKKIFDKVNPQLFNDFLLNESTSNSEFKKGLTGNLSVITCNGNLNDQVGFLGSERFDRFLSKMRDVFDYVVFDTPPVTKFTESQILSTKSDGVVLVIESSKTRRLAAIKAKEELESSGAKIFGVVINKRKFHIPKWLYNRL